MRDQPTRYTGPPLTTPELAQPITWPAHAYRKRESAARQAAAWNDILTDDPIHGPATGYIVGVAPIPSETTDGLRFELVWVHPAAE